MIKGAFQIYFHFSCRKNTYSDTQFWSDTIFEIFLKSRKYLNAPELKLNWFWQALQFFFFIFWLPAIVYTFEIKNKNIWLINEIYKENNGIDENFLITQIKYIFSCNARLNNQITTAQARVISPFLFSAASSNTLGKKCKYCHPLSRCIFLKKWRIGLVSIFQLSQSRFCSISHYIPYLQE